MYSYVVLCFQIQEVDETWEFDILLEQVSQEIHGDEQEEETEEPLPAVARKRGRGATTTTD